MARQVGFSAHGFHQVRQCHCLMSYVVQQATDGEWVVSVDRPVRQSTAGPLPAVPGRLHHQFSERTPALALQR
jgi:hypothetical protein